MKFGRYEIEKELGKGAMGVVYQAHDPQIDRRVALKVLRADRVTSDDFVQRFLKEARAIGRLSHPHIVTVYDVGNDHGTVYIAMEFLEGRPLNEILPEKTMGVGEIIDIGIQVATTLDYAHDHGIVHRDIKPSNIMVDSGGRVKITDFGIARIEDPAAPQLTQAGEILGTPSYMSPEQIKGQAVDGRSDLYSLGVILYEISTGRKPFTGKNIAAIFHAITAQAPDDPMAAEPFVARGGSPALAALISQSLDKAPESRFQTGKSMAEALAACLEGKDLRGIPPISQKKARRGLYVAIAVCFLIIAVGVFWIQGGWKTRTSAPGTESKPILEHASPGSIPPVVPERDPRSPEKPVGGAPSALSVNSNPSSAHVYLDGILKGKTPLNLDLPIGKYEVRVSLPDHYEWEAQVQLKDPGELPLNIRLVPMK